MPSWSALSEVPIEEYRLCASVRCGAGGGSRTHFSHPFLDAYYGLLRDVSAARRLNRSAFGGLANPGLVAPGDLDCAFQNRISLLKTGAFFEGLLVVGGIRFQTVTSSSHQSISFHTWRATCSAPSSVLTFPINSRPVLKTDIRYGGLVYAKTDSELVTTDSFGILVWSNWRFTSIAFSGSTLAVLSPHNMTTLSL